MDKEAAHLTGVLARHCIPVLDLREYDGRSAQAVKVGTVKRAKELKFANVFVPRVDTYLVTAGAAEDERVQRERRELFVRHSQRRSM